MPKIGLNSLPTWLFAFVLFGLMFKILWVNEFFNGFMDNYSVINSTYSIVSSNHASLNLTIVNSTYVPLSDSTFTNMPINDPCLCHGENFCYKGLDENGSYINGRRFDCSLYEGLEERGLLDKNAAETKNDFENFNESSWNPIFVTPISSDHFTEGRKLIKSISSFYPDSKIVIYDIGMKKKDVRELKTWCNVLYRKLDFDLYPPHMRRLSSYAFKMVNVEAFQEFKTFFFVDTTIRFTGKNLHIFLQGVKNKDLLPFSIHTTTGHSVYAVTDPRMYEYLPLPKVITYIIEIQSGFQFVTDATYTRHVLKWWYLCAMTENCIAPAGSTSRCKLKEYRDFRYTYMKCHRFDQAFCNLVALNYLFGETRGAVQFNYVNKNWTKIDRGLVFQVEKARAKHMQKYFRTVRVNRLDKMQRRLVLKCKNKISG